MDGNRATSEQPRSQVWVEPYEDDTENDLRFAVFQSAGNHSAIIALFMFRMDADRFANGLRSLMPKAMVREMPSASYAFLCRREDMDS